MTIRNPGDTINAICFRDGRVSATFAYRDVPCASIQEGAGVVKDILVASCDICQAVIIIPAQSTHAIAEALAQDKKSG